MRQWCVPAATPRTEPLPGRLSVSPPPPGKITSVTGHGLTSGRSQSQLHWSLEYCATAPHRSAAVIQCAAHGIVARPHRRSPDPAQQTSDPARSATPEPQYPAARYPPRDPFGARGLHGGFSRGKRRVRGRKTFKQEMSERRSRVCARTAGLETVKNTSAACALRHVTGGACQKRS